MSSIGNLGKILNYVYIDLETQKRLVSTIQDETTIVNVKRTIWQNTTTNEQVKINGL